MKGAGDSRVERQAGSRGWKIKAQVQELVTSSTDAFCLLQLPDDVKQNIEDAGARYIPYVLRPLELLGKHANPHAGEMVLPMTMTQDDQAQEQKATDLGTLCKAI